ncbi:MAG: redoxin domain-containing protein [Bacteroidia bacterium]
MNKQRLLTGTWVMLIGVILFAACNSSQPKTTAANISSVEGDPDYEIKVKVNNFTADKAYLAHHYGSSNQLKDSAVASNGSFTFKGNEHLPEGLYMVILPPKNTFFEVIIDKDQHFELETDTISYVEHMKVKGSVENEVMYGDIDFLAQQRKKVEGLRAQYQNETDEAKKKVLESQIRQVDTLVLNHRQKLYAENPNLFFTSFLQSMENPVVPPAPAGADENYGFYYYRKHFFDKVDFSDGRLLRSPSLWNRVDQYMDKLTVKHPDSINQSIDYILNLARKNDDNFEYLVAKLLNTWGVESKLMGMDAVYVHMVEKYYLSGDAWWADSALLAKMVERATALSPNLIGQPAPNFAAFDLNGNPLPLYDVDAKLTILYFWDYDCGHCKKITPELAKIYPKYLNKGVKVFAVSINGDVEVWKKKLAEYGLDKAINVQDHRRQSGFDRMYDVLSTPRIFILDKDKVIRYKQISVEQVAEILDHELEEMEKGGS